LVKDFQQGKALTLEAEFVEVWRELLQNPPQDKFLLSQMLILPSERYLGELVDEIDVDALCAVRDFVSLQLAKQLKSEWQALYTKLHDPKAAYHYEVEAVGMRQLKNTCLHYLMLNEDAEIYETFGMEQFKAGLHSNMTDTMGALRCLVNVNGPLRDQALDAFYSTWSLQPLIVDKWLALQASSRNGDTLSRIEALMKHPAFDLKNPNKVYALIGTLVLQNMKIFHAKGGEGYTFVKDCVLKLNEFNPIVAARMVKPLVEWRRFDAERRKMMQNALEAILQHKGLSKDVYELVSKGLD
jgi:aminopeptidase N